MSKYTYQRRANSRDVHDSEWYVQSKSESHIVLCEKDSIKTVTLSNAEFEAMNRGLQEGDEVIILKEI